jgi:hypothetical protein
MKPTEEIKIIVFKDVIILALMVLYMHCFRETHLALREKVILHSILFYEFSHTTYSAMSFSRVHGLTCIPNKERVY